MPPTTPPHMLRASAPHKRRGGGVVWGGADAVEVSSQWVHCACARARLNSRGERTAREGGVRGNETAQGAVALILNTRAHTHTSHPSPTHTHPCSCLPPTHTHTSHRMSSSLSHTVQGTVMVATWRCDRKTMYYGCSLCLSISMCVCSLAFSRRCRNVHRSPCHIPLHPQPLPLSPPFRWARWAKEPRAKNSFIEVSSERAHTHTRDVVVADTPTEERAQVRKGGRGIMRRRGSGDGDHAQRNGNDEKREQTVGTTRTT